MKPTSNFLRCLERFACESLSFAEELDTAMILAPGTKLAQLVETFKPLKSYFHLWLVAIRHDRASNKELSDSLFDYDEVTGGINRFLKKIFSSRLDHELIQEKFPQSHTISVVVSFHNGEKMTAFKIISSVLFQELPDHMGFYIPYVCTTADNFSFRGYSGDNRPWRRRGLTSLLLHLLQTVCQVHCKATSIFLECRELLVPTYTRLGFSRCDVLEKSWDVPEGMSLEPSVDLVRMWIGSRVVTTAAISATATFSHCRPFRSCCRDVAFQSVHAQTLFDLDVYLFEYIDSYEHEGIGYVARCTMCRDRSDPFSLLCFAVRFYEYAAGHMNRCPRLRRDHKRRSMVDSMHQTMKESLLRQDGNAATRVTARLSWLQHYCEAVSASSCIPGCGVPFVTNGRGNQRMLLTLPSRYSVRLARKAPTLSTGFLNTCSGAITHVQFTTSKRYIGYNISGSADELEDDFVKQEFHDWFLEYVESLSPRKVGVPDGASYPVKVTLDITSTDAMVSHVTQQLHRDTCVFSSALSAFKYFGDFGAVAHLRDRLFMSTLKPDRLNFLVRTLEHRSLRYQPVVFKRNKLNVLTDLSPFPTAVKLCGKDGHCSHVVTVVGRKVFDSNCSEPLPLSKATLDWCCSYNSGERNEFSFVVKAYRFTHDKPREYWRHTI